MLDRDGILYFSSGRPLWLDMEGNALTVEEANEYIASERRRVGMDELTWDGHSATIYTTFQCMDLSCGIAAEPELFETMIFPECINLGRWSTLDQARLMHERLVNKEIWQLEKRGHTVTRKNLMVAE